MIRRRVRDAGLDAEVCCHTFRATGITAYLDNGCTLENAQLIVAHESPRTTKLYDRTGDGITLDEEADWCKEMANLVEVIRALPLLAALLIALPLAGGFVGAYLGYDSLTERLETIRHRKAVESELEKIKVPVETIRRYEARLSADEKNTGVIRRIIQQYDQLRQAISSFSQFTGQKNAHDIVASDEIIIDNLRLMLGVTSIIPGPDGEALIIKVAPNTFNVIFAVPMRIAPSLIFTHLPNGVSSHVVEETNIGFTVIFTPQSTEVSTFGFSASAEL